MCGVAGFFGDFDPGLLDRMRASLQHRGPDGDGQVSLLADRVGLAHTRLSIIDLSDSGRQPMWDATETVVVSFNGEIYNFRELRQSLEADGFRFRSHSDTEVLLSLYLRDGMEMLGKLDGIFAFALFDTRSRELFVARDPIGIKPLYYCESPRGVLFASELKALLHEPSVGRDLDLRAVQLYTTYLWAPAPYTMLESVRKLEPGHAMVLRDGRISRRWCYYDLPYDAAVDDRGPDELAEWIRDGVADAVEAQLVADVEVGAFLSGGLDSSAVVAMARARSGQSRWHCFTIDHVDGGFGDEGFAEDLPYARRVAELLDVDLDTVRTGPEIVGDLARMIHALDEPQADIAPLYVEAISRRARERGIKVLLSGAGGDDIFSGYRRHQALSLERLWSWWPRAGRRLLHGASSRLPTTSPWGRKINKAFADAEATPRERLVRYFFWLPPEIQSTLYAPDVARTLAGWRSETPLLEALDRLPADTPSLNQMLYLDTKYFLADHNLNYTDKLSMSQGVEVRVPLLDVALVERAARVPPRFKQHGTSSKWILKKALEPVLPRDVIHRPKTGFGAPLRQWLRGPLKEEVDAALAPATLERRGLFDVEGVSRLIDLDARGRVDASYGILSLMCIETWCRIFLDGEAP